jgi:hypothetical protein
VVFDLEQPNAGAMRGNFPVPGVSAALVPGSDASPSPVRAGTHRVWAATYDYGRFLAENTLARVAGTVQQVVVVYRRDGGVGGLLDLNLHFSPGTGITAASAPEHTKVRSTLARMDALYREKLGVALGRVQYFDLESSDDSVADALNAHSIFAKASQPGADAPVANVLWVADLSFAYGFAGGIPGAPGVYRLPGTGVMIDAGRGAEELGILSAHEVGHYLGLWHTSDRDNRLDTIGDTPTCANTSRNDCPDRRNLMFPRVPTSGDVAVSAGQRQVVRASPLLYEPSYPDACGAGIPVTDLTAAHFASGTTEGREGQLSGPCGGGAHPERVHLLRLPERVATVEVKVQSSTFTPIVYVQRGDCGARQEEIICMPGDQGAVSLELTEPKADAYYVVVDGSDGAGEYVLTVEQTMQPDPEPPAQEPED